ncbi:hypothetical protein N9S30_00655, partial [bacterium]|nr:hypothetical protein [bacterium]
PYGPMSLKIKELKALVHGSQDSTEQGTVKEGHSSANNKRRRFEAETSALGTGLSMARQRVV